MVIFSRSGAGAVELAALEMPCTRKGTVGSNPTRSAVLCPAGYGRQAILCGKAAAGGLVCTVGAAGSRPLARHELWKTGHSSVAPLFCVFRRKGLACLFLFLIPFGAFAQVSQQQHGVQQLSSEQLILRRVLGANNGYLGGR